MENGQPGWFFDLCMLCTATGHGIFGMTSRVLLTFVPFHFVYDSCDFDGDRLLRNPAVRRTATWVFMLLFAYHYNCKAS